MSKRITKSALREFAFVLRCEAMKACEEAHEQIGNAEAALKERGVVKKNIAIRLEALLDEVKP